MNRAEFMRQPESLLQNVAPAEREEALQYYNDYFDDAGAENEQGVIEALGNPARVAENIKRGLPGNGCGGAQPRKASASDRALMEYGKEGQEPDESAGAGNGERTGGAEGGFYGTGGAYADGRQDWGYCGTGRTYDGQGMPIWAIAMLATVGVLFVPCLIGVLCWAGAWKAPYPVKAAEERFDLVVYAVEEPGSVEEVSVVESTDKERQIFCRAASGEEDILSLDIRLAACDFETRISEDGSFYLETENAIGFQSYVADGTLYIDAAVLVKLSAGGGKAILYMPEDYVLDDVYLEVGAGKAVLQRLCAATAVIEVGAGEVILDGGKIRELTLSVGAGRTELRDMEIGTLYADVNLGELVADCSLWGDYARVACAMGNVQMTLEGKEEEFLFFLSESMGNIKLGKRSYAGLSQDRYVGSDRDTDRRMDIECSMGNVEITFRN